MRYHGASIKNTYCCWLQSIMTQSIGNIIGNLGLLYSHALDLVGCMQTIPCFSKSISTKTYGYKNHNMIKIQRKILILGFGYSQIKNMFGKSRESLSSCCCPHVSLVWFLRTRPVHVPYASCAHPVFFLCTWPMHIQVL